MAGIAVESSPAPLAVGALGVVPAAAGAVRGVAEAQEGVAVAVALEKGRQCRLIQCRIFLNAKAK